MSDLAFAGSIFAFTARGLSLEVPTRQASAFARDVTAAAEDVYGESITVPENLPLWITEDGRPYLRVDAATDGCSWAWATPFKTNLELLYEGTERGRVAGSSQVLWSITDGTRYLRVISSGGLWSLVHNNGSGSVTSTVAAAPDTDQRFRLRARFGKVSGRVQLSQSLYDAEAGTWGEWVDASASGALAVNAWGAAARISLRETGHSGNSDTSVLIVNRGEEVAAAPPDAVDLAVAWFLARANRTLTFHGRSECRRIAADEVTVNQTVETIPDLGLNGRYFKQTTSGDRPKLFNDGSRVVLRAVLDWMGIFESDDDTTKHGDLFNATTGAVAFVMSSVPVGGQFANPVIGSASYHLFFDAGSGGKVGSQYGGTVVAVDYAVGTMIAGVYRRGTNRKFSTDAEAEVSGAGQDITSILGQIVELFRRNGDAVVIPNIDLAFLHTEDGDVSDGDLATMNAHLLTIKE